MSLTVDVTAAAGALDLRVATRAEGGTVLAVLGPNGAGKTTLLRVLAGLHPAAGSVVLDGAELLGRPAHHRRVGWVPQDGALFPHLSARDNVAFGLRRAGTDRRAAAAGAQEWLERLGVGDLARRRPAALSGGQAQRVALARALATGTRLLLLDEPLAALDVATRADVRHALREHLAAFTGMTLLVTHDPVDALSLADRLLVVEDGRVVQDGAPAEVTRRPRSAWVAGLLGANAYAGAAATGEVRLHDGGVLVTAEAVAPGPVLAVVPAYAVALHTDRPAGSPRNCWPVTVTECTAVGGRVRVHASGRPPVTAEVTVAAAAELELVEGAAVWAAVKATEVTVVPL